MKNEVEITGKAPLIKVWQDGKVIEVIRSRTRLAKRILQEGWQVVEVKVLSFKGKSVAALASEIREQDESWSSAMSRAHALQNH
ncbi:hypothetical protein [Phaeocystidibacter marisrubri]|uniref:Uncharacterized protein n=1 Tax=Phaeocystidibacter marisrubri TaxID=1577780 RepID=A0A6L3ZBL6_9FLAO|nr:hypothetical protein [Phaeocystidibacter marisrubri]KAB2815022.1 hypothetical protein F8C82_14595 [Phaeocystidibacter marisrubri]GGH78126.1 hypothetical protein GCM10011318_28880 [Phaeocystidibacter marisrubri]